MTEQVYPTKEDIAKILQENIFITGSFTGQIGIINIHHAIIKIHDLFHKGTTAGEGVKVKDQDNNANVIFP